LTYASAGHPPPVPIGFTTPEPIEICGSAPICCDLPTGHRQTTISLPAKGRVCFFSDGLLEARVSAEELLGRQRLTELIERPGPPPTAASLLERVREVTIATPDDMVACIVSPAGRVPPHSTGAVEELEVDREMLSGTRVPLFLEACGVEPAAAASLLARARAIAGADGTAVLRVERADGAPARATAHPGLSIPAWAAALGGAREPDEATTLALPTTGR
jgi:hypothetical protein